MSRGVVNVQRQFQSITSVCTCIVAFFKVVEEFFFAVWNVVLFCWLVIQSYIYIYILAEPKTESPTPLILLASCD